VVDRTAAKNPAKNPRSVCVAAAALAVVALHCLRWSGVNSGNGVDLEIYVRGAQAIMTRAPLYEPQVGVLPWCDRSTTGLSGIGVVVSSGYLTGAGSGRRWQEPVAQIASLGVV